MESSPKSNVVLGYNHNVKHKGNIYHVQTEDSGTQNPHIITHLFVGGNIIATKKTSYADIVHAENLEEIVRELMQEQHKAMLRNLVNGVYDAPDEKGGPKPVKTSVSESSEEIPDARPITKPVAPPAEKPGGMAKPAPAKFPPAYPQTTGSGVDASARPPSIPAPAARRFAPAATGSSKAAAGRKPIPAGEKPIQSGKRVSEKAGGKDSMGPTIFGEDLITEKSLDEVILGYLSGDSDDEI